MRNCSERPVVCVLGGTPSDTTILQLIPDSVKSAYKVISFNRPGFGGTPNRELSKRLLFQLAREAGLRKHDYGVIGISGGAPLAILLASKFRLRHCGVVSGMVAREAFFRFGEKAVTREIMEAALGDFPNFSRITSQFPNIDAIVRMGGSVSPEAAIRACYDEFRFVLSDSLFQRSEERRVAIDWWHGDKDVNVPYESAVLFLKNFPNAQLHTVQGKDHALDANFYIAALLKAWRL